MDRNLGKDQTNDIRSGYHTTWQIIKLYWQSEFKVRAYLAVVVIMVMTIMMVAIDVALSYWSNYFYDALQAYDKASAIHLLLVFFALAALNIVFAVYRYYISQLFGLRWRKWLTNQFIGRWLQKRDYYYMETFDAQTDNPDQRIQEDVGALVTSSINLSTGLVSAITTFFAFIYVLWVLSGNIHLSLGSWTLHIHGYLVWVAILYALIGTYFTFKIGRPLVALNFEQQRREASFRFAAIDLRSHAEHIALYRGEEHQKGILDRFFHRVLENWYLIIKRQKLLLWFTAGYNQLAVAVPLLVALPNYFGKVFKLGGLMQSLRAFSNIQDALSFLVNAFTQIAEWRAISQRLTTFLNHLEDIDVKASQENKLRITYHSTNHILAQDVTITTPAHDVLFSHINEEFNHGRSYLIKGPSGIGKSTFIRTLAGIWPFARGEIFLPEHQQMMYLSQKPYMPIGTLQEAILFPDHQNKVLENQVESILRDCKLDQFIPRLLETTTWSEQLSPGEQQRMAFARILLHRPDWVFLDESTSMLDLANEEFLYRLLKEKLPSCTIISVGHRPSLDTHHDQIIDMMKYA